MAPVTIRKATDGKHKFVATVHGDPSKRTIPFGAFGMSDYTLHHDAERRARYIRRHQKRENWGSSGRLTAGFYSKHLLWGPTTSLSKNLAIATEKYWPDSAMKTKRASRAKATDVNKTR